MDFYPCNKRETDILIRLYADELACLEYKRLRNAGATVTEALKQVEQGQESRKIRKGKQQKRDKSSK